MYRARMRQEIYSVACVMGNVWKLNDEVLDELTPEYALVVGEVAATVA